MAKAPTRAPVTQRGTELLALIAGAPNGALMLTQEEGLDAVNSGYAVVDTSKVEGNLASVSLTDAGRAALSGSGGSATKFAIRNDIPMPETVSARRGRQSSYPFDMLDVNGSFHVPLGSGNIDKLTAKLNSSISGARARFTTETGETKAVTVREYQRNDDGSFAKDAEGKRIVIGEREEQRPVKAIGRDFKLAAVGADDPDGEGVRIWRTV